MEIFITPAGWISLAAALERASAEKIYSAFRRGHLTARSAYGKSIKEQLSKLYWGSSAGSATMRDGLMHVPHRYDEIVILHEGEFNSWLARTGGTASDHIPLLQRSVTTIAAEPPQAKPLRHRPADLRDVTKKTLKILFPDGIPVMKLDSLTHEVRERMKADGHRALPKKDTVRRALNDIRKPRI
jgi:hypothetical protein